VASFRKDPKDASIPLRWTAQAITFLWKYMRTEWNCRNTVVHGSNDKEMAAIIKKAPTDKVREYYNTYRTTPTFILPHRHYLFTSRSLDQRLKLYIDSLNCWIRSVKDAIQALIHHNNQQRQQSARYFAPFFAAGRHNQTSATPESSDSEYPVSSIETNDNTMTTFTSSVLQPSSNTMDTISSSSLFFFLVITVLIVTLL
jgi:hypothetical protein